MVHFDTGDNPNRGEGVLMTAVRDLVALKCAPIKAFSDSTKKTFCYLMKDSRKQYFFLVARSTPLYQRKYFGSQTWIVKLAAKKDYPFVLAIYAGSAKDFLVFDPQALIEGMDGTNFRYSEQFGNFFAGLGEQWEPDTPVYPLYRLIQGKTGQTSFDSEGGVKK